MSKTGRSRASALRCAAVALAGLGLMAASAPIERITIQGADVYPESITSTLGGDIIVSSSQTGAIYRSPAGSDTATLWIDPKVSGLTGALGVFADDNANTLFVCSHVFGAKPDAAAKISALLTFDLKTGSPMARFPLPNPETSLCNDIATAANGTAYVAETNGGRILRLSPGGFGLEVWLQDERLAGADGLGVGADGQLYVNTLRTGRLYRVGINKDGSPGALTELALPRKLDRPDGMRHVAINRFVLAEGSGEVSEVVIDGDRVSLLPLVEPGESLAAVTFARRRVWFAAPKFSARRDPAFKDRSPTFTIDSSEASQR